MAATAENKDLSGQLIFQSDFFLDLGLCDRFSCRFFVI